MIRGNVLHLWPGKKVRALHQPFREVWNFGKNLKMVEMKSEKFSPAERLGTNAKTSQRYHHRLLIWSIFCLSFSIGINLALNCRKFVNGHPFNKIGVRFSKANGNVSITNFLYASLFRVTASNRYWLQWVLLLLRPRLMVNWVRGTAQK